MEAPLIGPANIASSAITDPTTIPAVIPFSRAPVETLRIANINNAVSRNSRIRDCNSVPAGVGLSFTADRDGILKHLPRLPDIEYGLRFLFRQINRRFLHHLDHDRVHC